jgi:drug/metabolite transporter (DMT)-like permease
MIQGLLLGALASILFNAAVILQAAEARDVSTDHGLRLSLLTRLVRQRRWLAGVALSVAGAGLQILALTLAPMTVVQPADAAGLVLLLIVGSRLFDERIGWRELVAVGGIVVGIAAIVAAEPARSTGHASAARLAVGLSLVGAVAAAPYLLRRRAAADGLLVVFAAGFAFAAAAFSMKLVAQSLASRAWLALALVAGVALATGLAGTLSEQTALQRRHATQVAAIVFVTELVVPLVLALTVGGERWGAGRLALAAIIVGVGVLIASVVTLSRMPAVYGLLGTPKPAPING